MSVMSPRPTVRPKSNEILVSIVQTDPEWQQGELVRILAILDSNPPSYFPENSVRENALRALCDLRTEEAARELARRLPGDERASGIYQSGLIRSPFRTVGVREMERMLEDPDTPLSEWFISIMSVGFD